MHYFLMAASNNKEEYMGENERRQTEIDIETVVFKNLDP